MEMYTMPFVNRGATLGPLNYQMQCPEPKIFHSTASDEPVTCFFCQQAFVEIDPYLLQHLMCEHKFLISNVKMVADLKSYIEYWRKRIQESANLSEICTMIKSPPTIVDPSPSEYFYILGENSIEDVQIREQLQRKRLEQILEQQQKERNDSNFRRSCLFCKREFEGNRALLFNHMIYDHNFSIGQPDNIVFGDELLELLEEKLKNLQCLYCEKIFKSWSALKEHMRKKQHKRIRPTNTLYDRFYVINYLELGKNWESIQSESDAYIGPTNENSEEEWDDWCEEDAPSASCLFCSFSASQYEILHSHMKGTHKFDFDEVRRKLQVNFYHQVKLVNYIRHQINENKCVSCDASFTSNEDLLSHMVSTEHITQYPKELWDQPQYYFPKVENDYLLTMLNDEDLPSDADIVMPEDMPSSVDEVTKMSLQLLRLEEP